MELFLRGGKVNFVDENNVVVGFKIGFQDCCEETGFCIVENLADIKAVDFFSKAAIPLPDLTDWVFDPTFCKKACYWSVYMVVFKMVKKSYQPRELYLVLMNEHNGYYSHGFSMTKDGTLCHDGEV